MTYFWLLFLSNFIQAIKFNFIKLDFNFIKAIDFPQAMH